MTERVRISDRLFDQLREAIVSGELENGSLHSIYGLASQFGVSRTPVRDAVLRLVDAGMVTIERNRGVRIRGLSVAEIRAIFEMRLLLEVPAAAYAAQHASDAQRVQLRHLLAVMRTSAETKNIAEYTANDVSVHGSILAVLGNDRVSDQVRSLREVTALMDASTVERSRPVEEVSAEHEPIVEAVSAGDRDAAAQAMATHLIETASILMRQVAVNTREHVDVEWGRRMLLSLGLAEGA